MDLETATGLGTVLIVLAGAIWARVSPFLARREEDAMIERLREARRERERGR